MGFFIIVTDIFYFVCLFSLCVQVFLCGCEHVWVHGVCVCVSLCFSLWDEGDLTEWMNDWVTLSVCLRENIRGTLLDDVQFILDWFIFSLKSFYLTLWFWNYFKMCIIKIRKARSREIYLDCSLCNLGKSLPSKFWNQHIFPLIHRDLTLQGWLAAAGRPGRGLQWHWPGRLHVNCRDYSDLRRARQRKGTTTQPVGARIKRKHFELAAASNLRRCLIGQALHCSV